MWLELEWGFGVHNKGIQGPLCGNRAAVKGKGAGAGLGASFPSVCKESANSKFNLGLTGHYRGIFVRLENRMCFM